MNKIQLGPSWPVIYYNAVTCSYRVSISKNHLHFAIDRRIACKRLLNASFTRLLN